MHVADAGYWTMTSRRAGGCPAVRCVTV